MPCFSSPFKARFFTKKFNSQKATKTIVLLTFYFTTSTFQAIAEQTIENEPKETLEAAFTTVDETHKLGQKSQAVINKISNETRQLLQSYQDINRNTLYQLAYQEQLQKTISAQKSEADNIVNKIENVKATQQQIMPLINKMANSLAQFVELDLPFKMHQRQHDIAKIKTLLADPQVSIPEKFQSLLKGYQKENMFSHTTEAYQGKLNDSSQREVKFIRVGRTALYYQTLDGSENGYWDHSKRNWLVLPATYRKQMNQAFKITSNKVVPTTLLLPIMMPKQALGEPL